MPSRRGSRWLGRVHRNGRELSKPFATKEEAKAWERQQFVALDTGRFVDPKAGRQTVREYGERWRARQRHHRGRVTSETEKLASTARVVESLLRLHVYPEIGDRRLSSIGRPDIESLVQVWCDGDAKPASIAQRYKFLRAVFNAAVADEILVRNPCPSVREIRLPEVVLEPVVPLTVPQVRKLVDAATEPWLKPLILLGAGCGPRVSEALGVTGESTRFLSREIHFRAQLSSRPPWRLVPLKARASNRVVPAPAFVLDALSTLTPGADGRLFAMTQRDVSDAFADAVTAAGLPAGTTYHDLRHHYTSLLINGGESVTVVAARLGHAKPTETLRTYAHLWPDSAAVTRRVVDAAWADDQPVDSLWTDTGG
jgi:integrase